MVPAKLFIRSRRVCFSPPFPPPLKYWRNMSFQQKVECQTPDQYIHCVTGRTVSPLVSLTGCLEVVEVLTHASQQERTPCTNVSRSEDFPPCFYPPELGFFPTLASFFVPGLRLPPASPRIAIHSCWHCPSCLPDPHPPAAIVPVTSEPQ